jgi:hypothetical protein
MEYFSMFINSTDRPAIFYIPHQDDAAIGMAGSISEHKRAERPIIMVLLTNGENDSLIDKVKTKYLQTLSSQDVINQRYKQFGLSALGQEPDMLLRIGLQDGIFWGSFDSFTKGTNDIKEIAKELEKQYPNSSHKFVNGLNDKWPNPTHMALQWAGQKFEQENPGSDCKYYRIYENWTLFDEESNPFYGQIVDKDEIRLLDETDQVRKKAAIKAYQTVGKVLEEYSLFDLAQLDVPGLLKDVLANIQYEYIADQHNPKVTNLSRKSEEEVKGYWQQVIRLNWGDLV